MVPLNGRLVFELEKYCPAEKKNDPAGALVRSFWMVEAWAGVCAWADPVPLAKRTKEARAE